jgi:hypothetical protein
VLLGDGQHRKRGGGGGRADRDVGAVVLIGLDERALGEIGFALIVLGDDDDLAPVNLHRSLGRVFESEPEACLGLFRVGLERSGETTDQGDLQIVGGDGPGRGGKRRREG